MYVLNSLGNLGYITAITHPQIDTLIKAGVLQIGLFDQNLCEVENEGIRYICRRNPIRASEIERTRSAKLANVMKCLEQQNTGSSGNCVHC